MSNSTPASFSSKSPTEVVRLSFNFARLAAAPTNPVWTVTWLRGTPDANVAAMKVGSAAISGTSSNQLIGAGVAGAYYRVSCKVQDGDQVWSADAILPVQA